MFDAADDQEERIFTMEELVDDSLDKAKAALKEIDGLKRKLGPERTQPGRSCKRKCAA